MKSMHSRKRVLNYLRPKTRYPALAQAIQDRTLSAKVEAEILLMTNCFLDVEDEAMKAAHLLREAQKQPA